VILSYSYALTPAHSQREREYDRSLSLWERVRVRVNKETQNYFEVF